MGDPIRRKISRKLLTKQNRKRYASVFAIIALLVTLGVAAVLRQRGVALTHEETVLDCPYSGNGAHTHNADCYDADGNLVCPLEEKELHIHDDSCYDVETELVCGLEEDENHTHTDDCYDTVRTLVCQQEEVTEEHVHGPGCFRTIIVDDGEPAGSAEADLMPAQEFRGKLKNTDKDGNEYTVLVLEANAPQGALPANTQMTAEFMDARDTEDITELIEADANKDNPADATTRLAVKNMMGVKVTFFDETGEEIDAVEDIQLRVTTGLVQSAQSPKMARVLYTTDTKEPLSAELLKNVSIVNQDKNDMSTGDENTMQFRSDVSAAYVVVEFEEVEVDPEAQGGQDEADPTDGEGDELDGDTDEGDGEGEGEEDAEILPMPAQDFEQSVYNKNGEEIMRVNVAAPEGAFPENTTMEVTRVKSSDVEDVVAEAVSEPDVRRGVTHIQAVDIVFRNTEGEEIEPKEMITVTMTADRIANEDTNPMLVHVTNEGSGELVSTLDEEQLGERELEASNDALVFDSGEFSIYAIAYTVDFHFDVDGENRDYSIAGGDSLGLRELLSMLEIVDDDQLDSFISEVDTVTFSDSSLMHVAKVEQNTTAGELKAQLGLEVEQTAGTTKAQLEAFDAREFVAPDWALITLRPFDTHETLTITMKSGDVVIINVTDARLVANVLVAKGETYTITVVYDEEAQIPEGAELVVTPVKKASDEYQQYLSDSAEEMGVNADAVTFARFFDIRIEADGAKVEPKSPVQVQIEYANAMELGLEDSLRIVHFADEGTEVIKDLTVSNDKTEVSYLQSSFSVTGTIISGPNGGQAGDYMVLVNYPSGSGDYYIVNNDASLTKVNYNAAAGTVDVENPMLWHVEGNNPNRHIYFHTEATGFQTNQTASDYYRRYLDPSAVDALTEETNGSTQEGYVHVDLEDRPWGSGRWWNNDAQREDWDNHIVSHNAAERKTALNYYNRHIYTEPWTDSHHFGVELDEDGNPVRLIGNQSGNSGVEFVFAEARSVPDVYYQNHTVNHIDISISGSSKVTVPLAYGTYYYEDPSNPGNMLEYVVTGDTDLDLEQRDISILPEDMKRATIRAYDKNGNELDNAFVVTGYSSNTTTAYSTPQVRIEGRFKVANLNYNGGNDQNTCNARLNNAITYTVSAIKPITYALIDTEHGYGQLYEKQIDGSYKPLSITVDVNMTASFDYWDEDNECPPLQETVNGGHNSDYDVWRRGGIPTHNMSGMDFVLGGDADAAGANIVAVEITKMVVDENGHLIKMDKSYQQTFGIHESSVSQHGNGGIDSHLNVIGVNVPAYTEEYGEYDKYTPEPIHNKEVSVGTDGMGLVFDYDVVPGMYYITEDPSDIPDEIVDQDGETWTYLSTHIETENVWRNDGSVGKHESDVYTDKNSDTYRSVPEVAGAYTGNHDANQTDYLSSTFWGYDDDDETWKEMEFRNGFLQFFVYNVYTHGKSLSVEKRWEPENLVPQGAEVTLELMYRKRLTGHMVNGEPVPIPDEDIEPWPDPAEWLPVKNDPLFDEGIHSTLTLKASVTAKQNWKGAFVGLPANVVDGDGNIYEVDFTAEETAVKIPGPGKTVVDEDAIDITSQYKVTEVKTEPTPESEETSEGNVTVTNLKGGVSFEKKWLRPDGTTEYTPTNSPAVVTAQLRRQKTETTEAPDELMNVTIQATAPDYQNGAMQVLWTGQVRKGSDLKFSVATNGTSNAEMENNAGLTGAYHSEDKQDITYSNGIVKDGQHKGNVYTLNNITEDVVITAKFAREKVNNAGFGYYIVHQENTPNIVTDTNVVDEAVATITLSQSTGWKYTFESTDMASGWFYYINTDPSVGPIPTEIGVSENQFAFTSTPTVTTDEDGNTIYTCTNVSQGVRLDVEKDWSVELDDETEDSMEVTVELQYKLRPADDASAAWSELAFVKDSQGAGGLFADDIQTVLTLTANTDAAKNWKGSFENLPTQVTDSNGTDYEVDYTAIETAVTANGIDVTQKYKATVVKTDATGAEAEVSDGTVTITNDRETITPTVEKAWDPQPTDANASATVELHRYAMITKGTIGVTLRDENGAAIEGAVYELYENGQATGRTVATNVNGKASFTNLGQGEYYLKQVSTPQEYVMEGYNTQTGTLTVEAHVTQAQNKHFNMTNGNAVQQGPEQGDGPAGAPAEDAESADTASQITDATPVAAPENYMEDSEFTPISYTITAADNWKHVFDAQDKYDADGNPYYYYVVETSHTPEDYWIESYDGDPLDSTGTITVTNKLRCTLDIEKTFSGNAASDLTAEQKAALTFTVTGPNSYSQTFNYGVNDAAHNATWTGDMLTITDLVPGTYTVTESGDTFVDGQQVPYLHSTTMTVNSTSTTGNTTTVVPSRDGATVVVDNEYDTAELEITKTITGSISALPEGKIITFTITGVGLPAAGITKIFPTDFDANGKVKLTHTDGIKPGATYTVTESGSGLDLVAYTRNTTVTAAGSTTFQQTDGNPTGTATVDATTGTGSISIVNNYEQKTVDIPVNKVWAFAASNSGVTSTNGTWPDGVEVTVALNSSVNGAAPSPTGATITLDASKTSDSFTDLPMYDANDNLIAYSVSEGSVSGVDANTFATIVESDGQGGYTITNSEKEAGLTITKSFTGAALTDAEKANITFTVTGDGLGDGLIKTYAEFENGQWVLTQADGIRPGKTYTVTETNANIQKYTRTSTIAVNSGAPATAGEEISTIVEVDETTGVGTVSFVNDYKKETTEISGTKTWIDGGREHNNADQIVLKLYRKVEGADDSTYELVTDGFTFAWSGNDYSFTGLDKYVSNHSPATDDDEKLYVYKVEEESVTVSDGAATVVYQKESSQTANGYDFTNTELTSITANKTWLEGENDVTNTMTNATVTFELQKKIGAEGTWTKVEDAAQDNPQVLIVTDAASVEAWVASWSDLPKYEVVSGTEQPVTYRVVETAAQVLETNVKPEEDPATVAEDGQVTISNTLPKTQIEVTKKWTDGTVTNADRIFDETKTIGFTVYQKVGETSSVYAAYGENGHGTVTYTPASGNDPAGWSTEVIENLPTYVYNTASGQWAKASYYVVEDTVAGVTTSYLKGQTPSETAAGAEVTDADADADRTITIVNTDELVELDIVKVDANGMTKKLEGAKFELQQIDPNNVTISVLGEAVYPVTTGADHKTGTNGEAAFAGLAAGYYRVREMETPAGYILPEDAVVYIHVEGGAIEFLQRDETKAPKQWTVMSAGNEKLQFVNTATGATATVGNTAGKELPHTGGQGTSTIYALGMALVMVAGAVLTRKRMHEGSVK